MTKTSKTPERASAGKSAKARLSVFLSRKERLAAGKALRATLPRERHASWKPPAKRRDPIDVLKEFNRDRLSMIIETRAGVIT
jgi:hypothetical protein